jgi:hypothetical protein
LLTVEASAQKTFAQQKDSVQKEDHDQNLYTLRKYSFSLASNPYVNITNGGGNYLFGATEFTFSDRLRWLDPTGISSGELNIGISFSPYQGAKLNLGLDYLLLHKNHKANLYSGFQFSQGLKQLTDMGTGTFVQVGYHSYITPFAGFVWWPWKANELFTPEGELDQAYLRPRISQLLYFKLQAGYSFLLNTRVDVAENGTITDPHLYQVIRNNTASTLTFRICIGINIPTYNDKARGKYLQTANKLQELQ